MKKRILWVFAVLVALMAGVGVVGVQRGKTCPPRVGVARYELTAGEDERAILAFIHYAIDASGSDHATQHRWPGAETKEEAVRAYEHSLTYRISESSGRRILEIWCLATAATAADGPTFPGLLYYADQHSVPSMRRGPFFNLGTAVTSSERFAYGLGMFPPGHPIN